MNLFQLLALLLVIIPGSRCVFEEMVHEISDFSPCLSVSTEHNSYGCSSDFDGNTGQLVVLSDMDDFHKFLQSQTVKDRVVLMASHLFTQTHIERIKNSVNRVVGILVANDGPLSDESPKTGFSTSPESKFCGSKDDPDSGRFCDQPGSHVWNPQGDGMLYYMNGFPIMLLNNQTEIKALMDCGEKSNLKQNAFHWMGDCFVTINSLMSSAHQSADICNRKSQNPFLDNALCSDMASKNVFVSLGDHKTEYDSKKKNILISAKMDHRSMFYLDRSGGALSTGVGLAVTLSLLDLLSQMKKQNPTLLTDTTMNVAFVFFDGEGFDFIGSTRFARDLKSKPSVLPDGVMDGFNKSNLRYMIELDQLGQIDLTNPTVFTHSLTSGSPLQTALDKFLKLAGFNSQPSTTDTLPPSSILQFSKYLQSSSTFDSALLSDYDTEFKTQFFHSHRDTADAAGIFFDDKEQLNNTVFKQKMEDLIFALAKSVLSLAGKTDDFVNGLKKDDYKMKLSELLYCITKDAECTLYDILVPEKVQRKQLKSRYYNDQLNTKLFKRAAAYFTGEIYPQESAQCQGPANDSYYSFDGKDICVRNASVFDTPAYISEDMKKRDSKLPYWVESIYSNNLNIKYHYQLPYSSSLISLAIGAIVTILALIFSILVHKFTDSIL